MYNGSAYEKAGLNYSIGGYSQPTKFNAKINYFELITAFIDSQFVLYMFHTHKYIKLENSINQKKRKNKKKKKTV